MQRVSWSEGFPSVKIGRLSVQPPGKTIPKEWFSESIQDFALWFIFEGRGELVTSDGETILLRRGSCLWLSPGVLFEIQVSNKEKMKTAWVHFDLLSSAGDLIPPANIITPPPLCEILSAIFFESTLRRIISWTFELQKSKQDINPAVAAQVSHLLKGLLYEHQLAHERQNTHHESGTPKRHKQVVSSAISWLHSQPAEVISGRHMAEKFGYSPKYFYSVFTELTGQTPTRAIILAKMEHAKKLLSETALNITEISDHLGYDNVYYFSKQFKQVVGVAPHYFRSQTPVPGLHEVEEVETPKKRKRHSA